MFLWNVNLVSRLLLTITLSLCRDSIFALLTLRFYLCNSPLWPTSWMIAAHSCIINAWSLAEFVGFCLFNHLLRTDHNLATDRKFHCFVAWDTSPCTNNTGASQKQWFKKKPLCSPLTAVHTKEKETGSRGARGNRGIQSKASQWNEGGEKRGATPKMINRIKRIFLIIVNLSDGCFVISG